jgi:hypothetical protein
MNTQKTHCPDCNQTKVIQTRPGKPYNRIISTACGCGYHVQVVAFLDPEKFASHDPKPGFSRDAITDRVNNFSLVLGDSHGIA